MARYPGAIWKPITADKDRQRLTVHNRMNLHVAVSEGSSLHAFFNKRGIPDSHFYVRRDGTVEQYVDTSMRAYADLEGNDATISVETQGMGGGGWDPKQREALSQIYAWAVRTHGLARKMATSSKIGEPSRGLSWHRLGCDGNFPALPSILAGRTQRGGGMHYSTSRGKICPGDGRIVQIPGIFARAIEILDGATAPKPKPPASKPAGPPAKRYPSRLPVLAMGSAGGWVNLLQERLGVHRDGKFGPSTRTAVVRFQKDNGLVTDGIVGGRTWLAMLTGGISAGDSGVKVKLVQNLVGLKNRAADGKFGGDTEAALKAVQRQLGVPVNGSFGPDDRAAVLKFWSK